MTGDSVERAGHGPASRSELRELMRAFLAQDDQETFEWSSVTTADGLPHNWIYDLFEDSTGTIWVGTWGGGLARYDGRGWTAYSKRDGLASNAVTCIREDSRGRLWIGTDRGITLYDGRRFTKAGLTGKSILTLHVDADDNVWAGAWRSRLTGGGLHRYDGRRWQSFGKRDGLPGVEILKVFEDSRRRIWVGTYDHGDGAGVGCWDGTRWQNFRVEDGLLDNCVYSMFEDPDGRMWFGTLRGVSVYDGRGWYRMTTADGLVHDRVYAMLIDADQTMWFGTEGGVSRYDGRDWTSYTSDGELVEDLVRAIVQDRDGGLWFGTYPFAAGAGGISVARRPAQRDSIEQKAARYLPRHEPRGLNPGTS